MVGDGKRDLGALKTEYSDSERLRIVHHGTREADVTTTRRGADEKKEGEREEKEEKYEGSEK